MKGVPGLIIAIALEATAAMLNYAYLASKSREAEKLYFVGVKSDATISQGDRLVEENLVPVGIPRVNVGSLDDFAVRWEKRDAVSARFSRWSTTRGSIVHWARLA